LGELATEVGRQRPEDDLGFELDVERRTHRRALTNVLRSHVEDNVVFLMAGPKRAP
jgi:hypothetical protein